MTQLVYFFGDGAAEGGTAMKAVLGSKGANLAEMTNIGIPVPPGFIVSTHVCVEYLAERRVPETVRTAVRSAMTRLEQATGRTFGGAERPLLVSVRSGAAVSMPGMMDTILNLGLNDTTAAALARQAGNPRFAYDSYRRLVQMYGDVVFDLKGQPGEQDPFEASLEAARAARGADREIDLPADDLRDLVTRFKAIVARSTGRKFPEEPWDQLWGAMEAVFRSWQNKRAIEALLRLHILRNETVHVYAHIQSVTLPQADRAQATVLVAMAGVPIASAQDLPALVADLNRFEIEFVHEGRVWRVQRAAWRRAEPGEFLGS